MTVVLRRDRGPVTPLPAPEHYVGLVTRTIAFGVDLAIVNLVALVVAAVVGLFLDTISVPHQVKTAAVAAGGVAYVLWTIAYFVTFWSTTGQTPGSRLLRIRVRATDGRARLLPRRALLRFAGLTLAAIPLGAGFLLILVNDRRQGLQDWLARTVVVDVPPDEPAVRDRRPAPPSHPQD